MTTHLFAQKPSPQQGAVLVISLVMLLLITIIGTAAMRTTTLEERAAGNSKNYALAFQAAESALREGERFLRRPVGPRPPDEDPASPLWIWSLNKMHPLSGQPDFNPKPASLWWKGKDPWWTEREREERKCPYGQTPSYPPCWWSANGGGRGGKGQSRSYRLNQPDPTNPLFDDHPLLGVVTEPLYLIEHEDAVQDDLHFPCTYDNPCTQRDYYRVTARAEGASRESVVILQSSFAWRYD